MGKNGNTVGSQRIPLVLSETQKAFVAGFLEGDGSISAKISPTPSKRLGYRVRVIISFTQHTRNKEILRYLQKIVVGSLKDYASRSMSELVIFDRKRVEEILKEILSYLIVKRKQAVLALEIIERFKKRKNIKGAN